MLYSILFGDIFELFHHVPSTRPTLHTGNHLPLPMLDPPQKLLHLWQTDSSIQYTGWWLTYPSEKYEFVSWDDKIPNRWKHEKPMFQTTNQYIKDILKMFNVITQPSQVFPLQGLSVPKSQLWKHLESPFAPWRRRWAGWAVALRRCGGTVLNSHRGVASVARSPQLSLSQWVSFPPNKRTDEETNEQTDEVHLAVI